MELGDVGKLSDAQRKVAIEWLGRTVETAPAALQRFLSTVLKDLISGCGSQRKYSRYSRELGRALGIVPSSEKRPSGDPLKGVKSTPKPDALSKRERLLQLHDRAEALAERHKALRRKHMSNAKKLKKKLSNLAEEWPSTEIVSALKSGVPVEEIELSDEEKAESKSEATALIEHLEVGGEDEPALKSSTETLMNTSLVSPSVEQRTLPVEFLPNGDAERVIDTINESRVRYDFSVAVTRVELEIEKKIVVTKSGDRKVVSASTADIGPPRYAATWQALATLAVMIAQYATPLNRLARMLTTNAKRFTAGGLGRMAHYIAKRFVPIYLELAKQLADCEILAGDDTSCRVLEVSSYFSKRKGGRGTSPPWAGYRTTEDAENSYAECMKDRDRILEHRAEGDRAAKRRPLTEPSLCVLVGRMLAFESMKRDGKNSKEGLHVTVATGRTDPERPESMITFYRTHFGSFGDLLAMLFEIRNPDARQLTVQADLSSSNFVREKKFTENFDIDYAGCSAHARRPFAQYEDHDPTHAAYMLHLFRELALHEHLLDLYGRNYDNVSAVRSNDSREVWEHMKVLAQQIATIWSKATPLGTAARYIIKHFEKLTAYLRNPRLEATNNLRERLLRIEKLIEKSSLFRRTTEGRIVLDILRTIVQTSVAARVPVHAYLVDVMKTDPGLVAKYPERYTPLAWSCRKPKETS